MPHVTIVGGGISGLATAYYLQQQGSLEDLSYTLLEADGRLGGKIVTDCSEDLVIEGGPDSFVVQKPEGAALCREIGLGDELIPVNRHPVFVYYNGTMHPIPTGFYLTVPANMKAFLGSDLFTWRGKLRAMMEPFIPARRSDDDESLADFVRRRIGPEIMERLAGPLMAGIFVADPEHLSMQGAFPTFLDMEKDHGSLMKAVKKRMATRQAKSGGGGKRPSPFLTLKGGLQQLVDTLAAKLHGDVRTGVAVTELTRDDDGFVLTLSNGESLRSDAVILAAPAYAAAKLVDPELSELACMLRGIRYVSTATCSLAYRRADLADTSHTDALGFLVADKQRHRIMACTFNSNKFDYRSPDDQLLLRVFVGGHSQESMAELPDAEIVSIVRDELRDILGLTAEPLTQRIFRWPQGNPQYDVGHLDRVQRMEDEAAAWPGLFLTGSAYRGIGIPGCVANAQRTVGELSNYLEMQTIG